MDKINLHRMTFYGYHGVLPEERTLGQRFIVDAELHLDLGPAGRSDDLTLTVNYAEAYELIKRLAEGEPYRLIESLAERIAETLLTTYTLIETVIVRVTKPQPPFAGDYDGVSVEVARRRNNG